MSFEEKKTRNMKPKESNPTGIPGDSLVTGGQQPQSRDFLSMMTWIEDVNRTAVLHNTSSRLLYLELQCLHYNTRRMLRYLTDATVVYHKSSFTPRLPFLHPVSSTYPTHYLVLSRVRKQRIIVIKSIIYCRCQ